MIAGEYFFHRNNYNRTCSRRENCGKTRSNQEQNDITFSKFDLYSQKNLYDHFQQIDWTKFLTVLNSSTISI